MCRQRDTGQLWQKLTYRHVPSSGDVPCAQNDLNISVSKPVAKEMSDQSHDPAMHCAGLRVHVLRSHGVSESINRELVQWYKSPGMSIRNIGKRPKGITGTQCC